MLHRHHARLGRISPPVITALVILFGIAAAAILFSYGLLSVPGDPPKVDTNRKGINDPVSPARPTSGLKVDTEPAGAYLFSQKRGGPPRYLGKSPLDSDLRLGEYTIYVFLNGVLEQRKIQVTKDRQSTMSVKLAGRSDGMVFVPGGPSTRGSDEKGRKFERPARRIWTDAFWIDKHEVSNLRYSLFLAYVQAEPKVAYKLKHADETNNGERRPAHREVRAHDRSGGFNEPQQPVCAIDWWDAYHYARWAGKRLPTEAEWEKAAGYDAKKKKKYDFPWGNDHDKSKGHMEYTKGRTAKVTAYPDGAAPCGALNMAGNVAEWCSDWYGKYYYRQKVTKNPTGPKYISEKEAKEKRVRPITTKVVRGGSGNYFNRFKPIDHRHSVYSRVGINPNFRHQVIGFRCARPATKEEIEREMKK